MLLKAEWETPAQGAGERQLHWWSSLRTAEQEGNASHRSAAWRCVAAQKAEPLEELSVWQEHGSLMDC